LVQRLANANASMKRLLPDPRKRRDFRVVRRQYLDRALQTIREIVEPAGNLTNDIGPRPEAEASFPPRRH